MEHESDQERRSAEEMYSEVLAKRVFELKETERGVDSMCAEMEKLYSEGKMEGRIEGKIEGRMEQAKEMARSLADMGIPVEKIAEAAKVSIKIVQEWLAGEVGLAK